MIPVEVYIFKNGDICHSCILRLNNDDSEKEMTSDNRNRHIRCKPGGTFEEVLLFEEFDEE